MSSGQPVRAGATVLVVRDAPSGGIEVLLLRRSLAAVFLPGAHCFPGGAVDPGDGADELDAARHACLREAFEECGLLLGTDDLPDARAEVLEAARHDVRTGQRSVHDVARGFGLTLDPHRLRYVSNWVTPPGDTRRFDTRFFVTDAPAGALPTCDGSELIECDWWSPAAALEAGRSRAITIIDPTVSNLEVVARFDRVADLLAALDATDPADVVAEPFGATRVRLPGEAPAAPTALAGGA